MILAADVGGTKTLLGLFAAERGRLRAVREASYPSPEFGSFGEIVAAFLAGGRQRVTSCGVGVAGPIVGGRSQVVNLRWPVDAAKLASQLRVERVELLNDLEATAWGVPELPRAKVENLTPGLRGSRGNAALIAAGTGLGMAILLWDGAHYHPSASEGGHQEFAPRDALEIELLERQLERHRRVSVERLVSGPGLSAIYQFLVETGRAAESRRMHERLAAAEDPNAIIGEAGVAGDDPLAVQVVDRFVSMYGSAAGDLALVAKATAGLWIGGGIAPRILPKLRDGNFLRAFRNKGRLSPLLESIPVRVILEPRTALIGAAACARRRKG
ncbi:MAG TPA: glucokinase [Candidatus Polarisedimenticolaceae bacterium]|nr:glucokinase [Candidatus Polarisedimenticolaceae bacterium]